MQSFVLPRIHTLIVAVRAQLEICVTAANRSSGPPPLEAAGLL